MNWNNIFIYDNGLLRWRGKPSNNVEAGDVAGCEDDLGYRVVTIKPKSYKQHRIIWEMHNGPIPEGMEIDHENHVRNDNRIENLRLVTNKQNKRNYTRLRNNTSGVTGVCWHKTYEKWQVSIHDNHGKRVYLGRFSDFDEAVKVRREAEKLYNYHPNHGDKK